MSQNCLPCEDFFCQPFFYLFFFKKQAGWYSDTALALALTDLHITDECHNSLTPEFRIRCPSNKKYGMCPQCSPEKCMC